MDLNFGAGNSVTPYNFGGTNYGGYGSLNQYGMSTPTLGSAAQQSPVLGNTLEDGASTSGLFSGSGLGANMPTLQLGLGGLTTLTNLYAGLKSLGLARDQFDFQKQFAQKNLANSTAAYNTALTDKATARAVTEGQSNADRDAYIAANKLS
jgi:hypothetical protein